MWDNIDKHELIVCIYCKDKQSYEKLKNKCKLSTWGALMVKKDKNYISFVLPFCTGEFLSGLRIVEYIYKKEIKNKISRDMSNIFEKQKYDSLINYHAFVNLIWNMALIVNNMQKQLDEICNFLSIKIKGPKTSLLKNPCIDNYKNWRHKVFGHPRYVKPEKDDYDCEKEGCLSPLIKSLSYYTGCAYTINNNYICHAGLELKNVKKLPKISITEDYNDIKDFFNQWELYFINQLKKIKATEIKNKNNWIKEITITE